MILTGCLSSPDDLRAQIEERLRSVAAEDLAPCKLGNIVFRASEVADSGGEIHATSVDVRVIATTNQELEEMVE